MTWTQLLAGSAAAIFLLAAGSLLFLPKEVRVLRSGPVAAAPAEIVALAASSEGYQRFNPYLAVDPALKIKLFGPKAGIGSGFRFEGRDGRGTQTVSAQGPDHVVYTIDLGPMGRPTQSLCAVPAGSGSVLHWEMQADLGYNPIARVMGLFMDRKIGPVFDRGIANINMALAET